MKSSGKPQNERGKSIDHNAAGIYPAALTHFSESKTISSPPSNEITTMSYKRQPNTLQVAASEYASKLVGFPARFKGKQKLGWTSAEKSNGKPWGYSKDPG